MSDIVMSCDYDPADYLRVEKMRGDNYWISVYDEEDRTSCSVEMSRDKMLRLMAQILTLMEKADE
jgi:hypothetical protein